MTNEEIDALVDKQSETARHFTSEPLVVYTRGCMLLLAEIAKRLDKERSRAGPGDLNLKFCLCCDIGEENAVCTCTQ